MGVASITNCCDEGYETQKLSIEVMAEVIAAARKLCKIRGSSFRNAGTINVSVSILCFYSDILSRGSEASLAHAMGFLLMIPRAYLEITIASYHSWRLSIMAYDPIVDEVRQFRDAYTKRFHYDLEAICRDIRVRQTQCGRKVVSLPPKPVQAPRGSREKRSA